MLAGFAGLGGIGGVGCAGCPSPCLTRHSGIDMAQSALIELGVKALTEAAKAVWNVMIQAAFAFRHADVTDDLRGASIRCILFNCCVERRKQITKRPRRLAV